MFPIIIIINMICHKIHDMLRNISRPHPTDGDTALSYGGEGEGKAKAGRRLGVDEDGVPVVVLVD